MRRTITATYRGGVFYPDEPCDLPEGVTVTLALDDDGVLPPLVTDPEERRRILKSVADRMMQNPISRDAPRFTRDELHERR